MSRPHDYEFHQFIDGRLSRKRAAEVQSWLDGHPEDAAVVDAWRSQTDLLRRSYHDFAVPVAGRIDASRRVRPFGLYTQLALSLLCLAIGLVAGYFMRGAPALSAATTMASLPHQAMVAHAVYSPEVRHPVEVGVNQTAHLAQWLSKRLGGAIFIPDLSSSGYQLLGGRLLPDETGPAAQFMYEGSSGLRLTLYVKRHPGHDATAFRFSSIGRLNVFYWVDGSFGYAISGEMERGGLLAVASAVHRQLSGR